MNHEPTTDRLPAFPCPAAAYIPHDPPMALIDRILAFDADSIEAEADIREDAVFAGAHGVPAWIGIEYMAQTVAAHAGLGAALAGAPVRKGFLLGTRELHWRVPQFPFGATLRLGGHRVSQGATGLICFDCEARLDGETVSQGRLNVFQPEDPDAFLAAHQ